MMSFFKAAKRSLTPIWIASAKLLRSRQAVSPRAPPCRAHLCTATNHTGLAPPAPEAARRRVCVGGMLTPKEARGVARGCLSIRLPVREGSRYRLRNSAQAEASGRLSRTDKHNKTREAAWQIEASSGQSPLPAC